MVLQGSCIMNSSPILWSTPPIHISGKRQLKAWSLVWRREDFLECRSHQQTWVYSCILRIDSDLLVAPAFWEILLLGSQFESKQCCEQFVTPLPCFPQAMCSSLGFWTPWHICRCWSFVCVSSISKDGYEYYCYKTKHNFSWAHPSKVVSVCWRSTDVTTIPKGGPGSLLGELIWANI